MLRMQGWRECPEKARLDPFWQATLRLHALSKVSPLTGWGSDFTEGAEGAVILLASAIDRAQAQRIQESQGGTNGPR